MKKPGNAGYGFVIALAGLISGATLVPEPASAQTVTSGWTLTGDLKTPRYAHTATLLPNGKVLVAGGAGPNGCSTSATNTAELYDAVSGTWSATGDLTTARSNHTATLLQNGEVLVAGGSSAELYDPATGIWRPTGSFNTIRASGSATLLSNGKVLVVGGSSAPLLPSAEIYDPSTGTWSMTAAPRFIPSAGHTVLLPTGKVLAVDEGDPFDYAELEADLYDPSTGQWSPAGSFSLFWVPTVTLLRNGNVLVTGLYGANHSTQASIYETSKGTWTPTGSLSTFRHYGGYTATVLPNGRVLVAGGTDYPSGQPVAAEELYDPATGTWSRTSRVLTGRSSHTATLLRNGKVLVAGGEDGPLCGTAIHRSAELYDPGISANPVDGTHTWTQRNSGLSAGTAYEVAVDAASPTLMYAATAGGLFKTTDAGNAWARSGDLPYAIAVAIDPNTPSVVFASNYDSARKTTDGGATWSEVRPNPAKLAGARALAIDPSNPSTVYAVLVQGGLSKSVDGGSTFSLINSGLPEDFYYGFDSSSLTIDPSAPSTVFAANDKVVKSTNGGASWGPGSVGCPICWAAALAVDPSQSQFVYAATGQGLFRSSDGGHDWERLENGLPSPLFTDVVVDPWVSTNVYVSTNDSGVFKSSDRGKTWTAFNDGLTVMEVHSLAIDSTGTFLAAATAHGVFTFSSGADVITLPRELQPERLGNDPERLTRLLEQVRAPNASSKAGLLVAVAGNAPGAFGTHFLSDVTLVNGNAAPQDVIAVWLTDGSDGTDAPAMRLTLPPSAITVTNFVGKIGFSGLGSLLFFGIDANANVDTAATLTGFSRIWTAGPDGRGSVSEALPAVPIATLGGSAAKAAIGLRMDPEFRTNVGIVNLDRTSRTFVVTLTGERKSSTMSVVVNAFSMRQVPLPEGDYGALTALFTVAGGDAFPWTAYGSSIDNLTGDGWVSQAALQLPRPSAFVAGRVMDPSGACLHGAVVELLDRSDGLLSKFPSFATTDCSNWNWYGEPAYAFLLPAGITVRMRASMSGYQSKEETFLATIGPDRESNFVLAPQ